LHSALCIVVMICAAHFRSAPLWRVWKPSVSPNPELKPNPHPSQVYRLFDMYDKDGDGTIDYSELTLLLEDEKPSWLQSAGTHLACLGFSLRPQVAPVHPAESVARVRTPVNVKASGKRRAARRRAP
jgi:hypothetical protein